jgi:3-oxoacyl-[acyl-carrier-protein] synthase-3
MKIKCEGVKIVGTGSAIPNYSIKNNELWSETAGWVSEKLGIHERRFIREPETLTSLCVSAANEAMIAAGISSSDLDCIIVATSTPDFINPSMASIVHGELNASANCAAFDIQGVCAGFIYALGLLSSLVNSKSGKYFLLIGADAFSQITDFSKRDCVFFGDAAGALIFESTNNNSYLAVELSAYGGAKAFRTPKNTSKYEMNSKEVSIFASKTLPESVKSVCDFAEVSVSEISYFFTHQPSKPVLDNLENALKLKKGVLQRNISKRGNTAAATVPLLFHESKLYKKINKGDLICFSGIGAGWVWGSAIMKWES